MTNQSNNDKRAKEFLSCLGNGKGRVTDEDENPELVTNIGHTVEVEYMLKAIAHAREEQQQEDLDVFMKYELNECNFSKKCICCKSRRRKLLNEINRTKQRLQTLNKLREELSK